jgi:hypothetical protein
MATRVSTRTVIASLMLAAQAAIGMLTALALFASAHRWGRFAFGATMEHRRIALGMAVLLLVVGIAVIALGVASGAGWARICAIAIEVFVAFVALARFRVHPIATLLAIAYAATVVALLISPAASTDDSRHGLDDRPSGTSVDTSG